MRRLIQYVKVAWGDCSGAAVRQKRQPERLLSEERVSSRSTTRRQKRRHQWLATYYVSNHQKRSTSKLE